MIHPRHLGKVATMWGSVIGRWEERSTTERLRRMEYQAMRDKYGTGSNPVPAINIIQEVRYE